MLLKRELYKTVALNLRRRAYIVNWHLFRFSHFIFINHFLQSMKIFSFFCIDFIILSKWKTRSSIQQEFSCAGLVYKDFNSMAVCSYLYPFIMADIQKSGFFSSWKFSISPKLIVMLCTIWFHLYNLKDVKNTHGGVLLLPCSFTKNSTLMGVYHVF